MADRALAAPAVPMFVASEAELEPVDAVAAILIDHSGRYLLQHRDSLPHIFYPDHWGCFGGAIEPGEAPVDTLVRELREELELETALERVAVFTRFEFDFRPFGKGKVFRLYYEVRLAPGQERGLRLHEGQALGDFEGAEIFGLPRVTPYDAFALWMHQRALKSGAHWRNKPAA
jgi:8-oxo-dGTP pyrophosphatase MutT (NUDIX family)